MFVIRYSLFNFIWKLEQIKVPNMGLITNYLPKSFVIPKSKAFTCPGQLNGQQKWTLPFIKSNFSITFFFFFFNWERVSAYDVRFWWYLFIIRSRHLKSHNYPILLLHKPPIFSPPFTATWNIYDKSNEFLCGLKIFEIEIFTSINKKS